MSWVGSPCPAGGASSPVLAGQRKRGRHCHVLARQRRSGQSLAEGIGKGHMRSPGSRPCDARSGLLGLTHRMLGKLDHCPFQELLTGWGLKASERMGRSWQP